MRIRGRVGALPAVDEDVADLAERVPGTIEGADHADATDGIVVEEALPGVGVVGWLNDSDEQVVVQLLGADAGESSGFTGADHAGSGPSGSLAG